jgi:DNA-directed RNA polymerase specialized sigma24 family protein
MSERVAQSSTSEFEQFYRRFVSETTRYVSRRVPPESRDEVVANTFVAAWRKFGSASEPSLQWLYRIAYYEVSHELRRLHRSAKIASVNDLAAGATSQPSMRVISFELHWRT